MSTRGSRKYTSQEQAAYWKKQYLASKGMDRKTYSNYRKMKPAKSKPRSYEDKASYYKKKATKERDGPGLISKGAAFAGGFAGGALGGPIGGAVGTFLGGKIGHLVEQITGFGDYKVQSNSIMSGGVTPPSIVNTANRGGIIVRHREYIGDVLATTAFTVQSFMINPGLFNTFPWLSQIAMGYEQYKPRGMIFEFLSTSSDALLSSATSTALGTVSMATQYDVSDPPFTDKRSMLNHEWSNSRKPSMSFIHPIECKNAFNPNNLYYNRVAAVPAGSDPARFDFGRFCVATEGMQASGGVLGELWVTFEVELTKQQFSNVNYTDHFRLNGCTNSAPLGTSQSNNIANGGTIGGTISSNGRTYSLPPLVGSGVYLLDVSWGGTPVATSLMSRALANASPVNMFANGTTPLTSNIGDTTGIAMFRYVFVVTAQGASFTFNGDGTLPTSISVADLVVTQISSTIIP